MASFNLHNAENSDIAGLSWFALQVWPKLTRTVAEVLGRKGYEAFTPCSVIRRRWSDRERIIEVPLFPGYVFVKLDLRYRLDALKTPGVHGIVGIGKQPTLIPDNEIANVRNVLRSGAHVEPCEFLRLGDSVQIARGPLSGISGILIDTRKTCRVVISVELIERSISVEVDRSDVGTLASNTEDPHRLPSLARIPGDLGRLSA